MKTLLRNIRLSPYRPFVVMALAIVVLGLLQKCESSVSLIRVTNQ